MLSGAVSNGNCVQSSSGEQRRPYVLSFWTDQRMETVHAVNDSNITGCVFRDQSTIGTVHSQPRNLN